MNSEACIILDGHIHTSFAPDYGPVNRSEFEDRLIKAGIEGGVIISMAPNSFFGVKYLHTYKERLDNLFKWKGSNNNLYPFFWIDPIEDDALEQVDYAASMGVSGFKVICSNCYPDDSRAMKVYSAIAAKGKPILFHSGILWDGKASSQYNRPYEFEALLNIEGLRFSLAHASWPWCDECLAVYGKFLNAYTHRPDLSVEMFIDITPGTPPIYRDEVLTKLFTVGYDIENNIIFGSDCIASDYNKSWARQWIDRDNGIYNKIGLGEITIGKIYSENLKRFLGISQVRTSRKLLHIDGT